MRETRSSGTVGGAGPIGVKIRIAVGQVDKGKDYGKDKGCLYLALCLYPDL